MSSKKELKESYKEMKFKIGVFQIKNLKNNKIFIDSSTDLISIFNRYKFQLNAGQHQNSNLQKDWAAFGQENFAFEILSEIKQDADEMVDYRKMVKELSLMFIEELQPYGDLGYNINHNTRK